MIENEQDSSISIKEIYKVEKELNGLIKDIVKAIISTASIDEMSKRVYRYLKDHFGECTFGLAVNNIVERKLTNIYFYENEEVLKMDDISYENGEKSKFLETIFSKKEILYLEAAKKDFHFCNGEIPNAAYFSPLIIGDESIGAFTFQLHTRSKFTEKELRVCREIIPFLTISLNNSLQNMQLMEVNEKLKRLSEYDDLTGLYNRRSFYERLNDQRESLLLKDKEQYLLLMDLDNFKGVNDNYGHDVGDQTLITVADILRRYFDKELLGRFGGDEFMGGMLGVSKEEVEKKVVQIIDEVRKLNISSSEDGKIVGVSIGLLKLNKNRALRNHFKKVDQLMYKAKNEKGKGYVLG